MNWTKWLTAVLFCVSILIMALSSAQAESYNITWINKLADVPWKNGDAYCNVSVDWINLSGQVVQTFASTPALKVSERQRTQVVSRSTTVADKCAKMKLHASCMNKPSPQWQDPTTQVFQLDVTPCASGPAEIRPYYTGIVWNPNPGSTEQ